MLHEFASSADVDTEGAQHALALAEIWLSVLFVLDVHIKSFTFEEDLQVGIVLENRVTGDLVQHPLQCSSSRLDKVRIKSPNSLFLWRWCHDNSWVVVVQ